MLEKDLNYLKERKLYILDKIKKYNQELKFIEEKTLNIKKCGSCKEAYVSGLRTLTTYELDLIENHDQELNDYSYPGINLQGETLPSELIDIFNYANNLPKELLGINQNENFNQALVNFYDDGTQYIAPHSDYGMKIVFSASFGQERVFRIINKKTISIVKDIIMKDRTFMIMCGNTQKEFLHTILQDSTQNKRLNITFRIT